jgi:hypothetical protein
LSFAERGIMGAVSPAGVTVGLILIAVGAILAFAVEDTAEGVNVAAVGWILIIVGGVAALISLIFWAGWQTPYRRRTYAEAPPTRRRVVEEEDVGPPGPPLP